MTETANLFFLGAVRGVKWGTVAVQVLAFIVLLTLPKKFAWGPLKDVMDKHERDINRDIDDAEQTRLNTRKFEEENKQKLRGTQEEIQKILEDTEVQTRQQQEQIIHEASVHANDMTETAQSEVNDQKECAIADINNQVPKPSVLVISKILRKEISEQDQKVLVNKYLKEASDK